ncbi:MAG: tetratricopeptide repeat protein [Pirellulales bacterium]|nr:tetratricopeptide repeat protein [Pirellulales bacterium]
MKDRTVLFSFLFLAIALIISAVFWYSRAEPNSRRVTFNREIAPIIFSHCASCHRPEESAPFSLLSYGDVVDRAEQIVEVTESRYMPPWLPKSGYGHFSGDRRLSQDEIDLLADWVAQGAIEGDPDDLPEAPSFVAGWQLGEPDLVIDMPETYRLRADGSDVFHNFVLPIPNTTSRFVRAVELRPSNRQIVHHANMLTDSTGAARKLDRQEPGPGYAGMENLGVASRPSGHFLSWKVGSVPFAGYPEKAWRVDPGSDLVVNMHMLPSGKIEEVRAKVGIYFSEKVPSDPSLALIQLEADRQLDIPAGEKQHVVTDRFTLPVDVDVLAIYPHAHLLGQDLQGYALLPDGRKEWLIWIDDWDWNWQAVYRYRQPLSLPRGTELVMQYTFDNSASNPRNPHQPPRRVTAGNRTEDEMAHLWIQVLPQSQDDLHVLNEVKARHQLSKYPRKSEQKISLGLALANQGKIDQAAHVFREATSLNPQHVGAHYNLACMRSLLGKTPEAKEAFRAVLKMDPDHVESHNNLAIILFNEGKLESAVEHYRHALRLRPQFAIAHNNLGLALQRMGKLEEAAIHYRRALKLRPDYEVASQRLKKVELELQGENQ